MVQGQQPQKAPGEASKERAPLSVLINDYEGRIITADEAKEYREAKPEDEEKIRMQLQEKLRIYIQKRKDAKIAELTESQGPERDDLNKDILGLD